MRGGQTDHPAHRRIRAANEIDRLTWGEPARVIELDEHRPDQTITSTTDEREAL